VSKFACLIVSVLLAAAAGSAAAAAVPAELSLRAVGHEGVDVLAGGRLIAPLRLSSNGVLTAQRIEVEPRRARLTGLVCRDPQAVAFSPDSFVALDLAARPEAQRLPELSFRLRLTTFNAERWQKLFDAPAPFHFLTLALPSAQVWHQRGWLNATPNADPFPLLGDMHVGDPEISELWNRNWSYVCPMGGSPIPVIGLWDPAQRLYLGYDFARARATDQTERYVAAAYCWRQGADRSFVSLCYPYGGLKYKDLVFPAAGDVVESHASLIVDTDLPATEDPNERFQARLFADPVTAAALPPAPAANDVGWVAGAARLNDFLWAPGLGLYGAGGESTFYPAGTELINGWGGHREMPLAAALARGDQAAVDTGRRQLEELLTKYAQRFEVEGEPCLYWTKPLTGDWREAWGGPGVKTLHNSDGWFVARVLVEYYRLDRAAGAAKPAYLDAIDRLFNWAKHYVWTRNEFADVPSSPFAIGSTLASSFLLDYWFTFHDDPQRAANAELALKLADHITWRYLQVWAMDSDRSDAGLDSAFLAEPNSGRDWAGLACANEVFWNVDALCQVYVHTGDERMRYYLRGMLARWPQLYRPVLEDSLADCDQHAMTEGLGLFDGAGPGRGERYTYGWHDFLTICQPVGASKLRVVAGRAAALGIGRDGLDVSVARYRTDGAGSCQFVLLSSANSPTEPFDVSFSYPDVDISKLTVSIARDGRESDWSEQTRRPKQSPSSLYLSGLKVGDSVTIGTVPPEAKVLDTAPLHSVNSAVERRLEPGPPPGPMRAERFLPEPSLTGTRLPTSWTDPQSFAGLDLGLRWSCGVPYMQGPEGSGADVDLKAPAEAQAVVVAYAPPADAALTAAPSLLLDNGARLPLRGRPVVGWRGWPPMFQRYVLLDQAALPAGRRPVKLLAAGCTLMSVTWDHGRLVADDMRAAWDHANLALRAEVEQRARLAALRQRFAGFKRFPLAVIPPEPGGRGQDFLAAAGFKRQLTNLNPAAFVNPAVFNAKRFPLALYLDGEDYVETVKTPGDGVAALTRYLADGGTLVCFANQPLPFCYGLGPDAGVRHPASLLPTLGFPLTNAWEKAPDGLTLHNVAPNVLTSLPAQFAWPDGDPRLRWVVHGTVDPADTYTPLVSVHDKDGKDLGDAACVIELGHGPAKGGRIAYVWSTLATAPQGIDLLSDVWAAVLAKIK
jgi:hypothetical protein